MCGEHSYGLAASGGSSDMSHRKRQGAHAVMGWVQICNIHAKRINSPPAIACRRVYSWATFSARELILFPLNVSVPVPERGQGYRRSFLKMRCRSWIRATWKKCANNQKPTGIPSLQRFFPQLQPFSLGSFPATAVTSAYQTLVDSEAFQDRGRVNQIWEFAAHCLQTASTFEVSASLLSKASKLFSKPCWIKYWFVCSASPWHNGSVLNTLIFKRDRML